MEPDEVDALRARITALLELGRFEDASKFAASLISVTPGDSDAWCLLAQCRFGLDDDNAALEAANHAVTLAPDNHWPHRIRALVLNNSGRLSEAEEAVRRALTIQPDNATDHALLADVLMQQKFFDAATQAAQQAMMLDPMYPSAFDVAGLVELACDRNDTAESYFRAGLQLAPQDAGLMNSLGVSMMRQGLTREAAFLFAESSRLDPRSSLARDNAVRIARARRRITRVYLACGAFAVFLVAIDQPLIAAIIVICVVMHANAKRRVPYIQRRRRLRRQGVDVDHGRLTRQEIRRLSRQHPKAKASMSDLKPILPGLVMYALIGGTFLGLVLMVVGRPLLGMGLAILGLAATGLYSHYSDPELRPKGNSKRSAQGGPDGDSGSSPID